MASITKVSSGYRVREAGVWRERPDGGLYRDRKVVGTFATKREALAAAAAHETRLRDPGHVSPHELTAGEWRRDWMERRAKKVEVSTARDYQSVLDSWWGGTSGSWGTWEGIDHLRLQSVGPEHLIALQDAMLTKGITYRTRKKVWGVTSDVLADARRKRRISWDPSGACDPPNRDEERKTETTGEWWEPGTVAAFLAYASPDGAAGDEDFVLRSGIALAFHLGTRPGETAALRWSDRRDGDVIHISRSRSLAGWQVVEKAPKTENGVRDIPLTPAASGVWTALREQQRVVPLDGFLLSVDGVPIHPAKLSAAFQTLQEGFRERHPEARRLKFYDVRHVALSSMLRAGVDLRIVSRLAGHSSYSFTWGRVWRDRAIGSISRRRRDGEQPVRKRPVVNVARAVVDDDDAATTLSGAAPNPGSAPSASSV